MPNGGSVNQIEPSDLTTTSLGELSGLPSNLSRITVMVPSYSVRTTRRPPCSQVTRLPGGPRAKLAEQAGFFVPLHDAVVGDVAPQHVATVADPHRPFAPAHAGREPLDRRVEQAVFGKARIEHLDGGVGIPLGALPGEGLR